MKILAAILFASSVSFAIDKVPDGRVTSSCAIRISNMPFEAREPENNSEFCSGTLIGDGSVVAMAAHCLSQVFEFQINDISNVKKNSLNIAVADQTSSRRMGIEAGQNKIFAGERLRSKDDRDDYLDSGDPKYVRDDIALIKLETGVSSPTKCPRLPTQKDCQEFEDSILKMGKDTNLFVDFFISNELKEKGSDISKKVIAWYPDSSAVKVSPSAIKFSPASPDVKNLEAPLNVSFEINKNVVKMRKGDSGSALIWRKPGGEEKILIGTQSATFSNSEKAYFAQICKQIKTKEFESFVSDYVPKTQ
ncbi:MAG TPA: trypsin-like serine protease [Bdellovibrio sp.]|nr:trypsin-like serine protease [Bdellovibrio sp.]